MPSEKRKHPGQSCLATRNEHSNVHKQAENEALTIPNERYDLFPPQAHKWSFLNSLLVMVLPSLNVSSNTIPSRLSSCPFVCGLKTSMVHHLDRNCFNQAWRKYRTKYFKNGSRSSYADGTCMWHTRVYEVETTIPRSGTSTHPSMDMDWRRAAPSLPLIVVSAKVYY